MIKKIVKFTAQWCGPCRAFTPIFEAVGKMEEFNNIEFKEIDVDGAEGEDEDLAVKLKIRNIPTVVLLDENDNLVDKAVGALSRQEFIDFINKSKQ